MFKSLQWKIVAIFVLLILAVMSVAGTFLIVSVTNFYHDMFAGEMDAVFTESFINQISAGTSENENFIKEILKAHTIQMGIDSYRSYYLISATEGRVIDSSVVNPGWLSMETNNLITALSGTVGKEVHAQSAIMDYAVPVKGDGFFYII